jgi:AcrR family transcriptional regulator
VSSSVRSRTARPRFVPPPPPRTPKSARTRQRLLDVAADLFIERGYSAVSMRDVALAADLTKGAVYGHFRSKGQLLVEVIRWKVSENDHAPGFSAATEDPEHNVELMWDQQGRTIRLLEVDAAAAARHDPDVAAGLTEFYRDRHDRIRAAAFDLPDPDTAAWLVAAITAGIGMKEAAGLPLPAPDRLRAAVRAALDSLT